MIPNISLLRILILTIAFCWTAPASHADTRAPIKIGVILPLTGDMAFAGAEVKNGMTLAKEQTRGAHFDYQLIFEDNGLDLKRSVAAAKKLIDVEKRQPKAGLAEPCL